MGLTFVNRSTAIGDKFCKIGIEFEYIELYVDYWTSYSIMPYKEHCVPSKVGIGAVKYGWFGMLLSISFSVEKRMLSQVHSQCNTLTEATLSWAVYCT